MGLFALPSNDEKDYVGDVEAAIANLKIFLDYNKAGDDPDMEYSLTFAKQCIASAVTKIGNIKYEGFEKLAAPSMACHCPCHHNPGVMHFIACCSEVA